MGRMNTPHILDLLLNVLFHFNCECICTVLIQNYIAEIMNKRTNTA